MRVLIAHDVGSCESVAVQAAAERPWPPATTFCILNVNVPLTPPLVIPRLFENSKTAILERLAPSVEVLKQSGLKVRTEVLEGSPRRVINAFAKEWNADLVMVGAHERSPLARLFLGSTALSVMRHAPCSVEIVRAFHKTEGRGQAGMNILVGTDGSEFSAAALRSVVHQPWPAESRIKVISVPEFALAKDPSYFEAHEIKEFKELGTASIEEAKACIVAAREIMSASPLTALAEVPTYEDRTYQVILHEANSWQADLIVVGSHGRSGFDRVVMGSVSEAVALHAKCSVQIVRERNGE